MFWTSKLSFDVDILVFFGLATVLSTFQNIGQYFFFNFSGPPEYEPKIKYKVAKSTSEDRSTSIHESS